MELAYRFSEDIEGYCTGKDAFVKQLEKDALLWYQNNESYKTRQKIYKSMKERCIL